MNELALFAGAGGGILGGKLLGWRTVAAVEIEEYPRAILLQRQDDGIPDPFPVWDDVTTFDGRPWRGHVDVISGGFPCQDISSAGKGAGITGAKSGLWNHMARIIGEVQPPFVFVENSPLLVSRGLDHVLADVAALGYDAEWGVIGAHNAGAPHRRDRIWILAYTKKPRMQGRKGHHRNELQARNGKNTPGFLVSSSERPASLAYTNQNGGRERRRNIKKVHGWKTSNDAREESDDFGNMVYTGGARLERHPGNGNAGAEPGRINAQPDRPTGPAGVRDAAGKRLQNRRRSSVDTKKENKKPERSDRVRWWNSDPAEANGATESQLGRVAHGVAHRVDRIKAIGNGQVPAVAALAWTILIDRIQQQKKETE